MQLHRGLGPPLPFQPPSLQFASLRKPLCSAWERGGGGKKQGKRQKTGDWGGAGETPADKSPDLPPPFFFLQGQQVPPPSSPPLPLPGLLLFAGGFSGVAPADRLRLARRGLPWHQRRANSELGSGSRAGVSSPGQHSPAFSSPPAGEGRGGARDSPKSAVSSSLHAQPPPASFAAPFPADPGLGGAGCQSPGGTWISPGWSAQLQIAEIRPGALTGVPVSPRLKSPGSPGVFQIGVGNLPNLAWGTIGRGGCRKGRV